MKIKRVYLTTLVLTAILTGTATAQKIGYVNSQYLLSQLEEFREAQNKLQIESQKMQKQLAEMSARLDSLQSDYERQKFLMTEANRKLKEQEITRLANEIQQFQVAKLGPQGELYKKQQELAEPVLRKVNDAIKKVGERGNYDFIFDTVGGNILFAKESYDLTNEVLNELRKAGGK